MIFERDDLVLLRKAIKTSLGVATMINIPKLDQERLVELMDDIDDELEKETREGPPTAHATVMVQELSAAAKAIVRLSGYKEPFKIGSKVVHKPPHSQGLAGFGEIVEGPFDNGPYGLSWKVELLPIANRPRETINVPEEHLQQRCNCCERGDEYNGFHSGTLLFECPKHCACHD